MIASWTCRWTSVILFSVILCIFFNWNQNFFQLKTIESILNYLRQSFQTGPVALRWHLYATRWDNLGKRVGQVWRIGTKLYTLRIDSFASLRQHYECICLYVCSARIWGPQDRIFVLFLHFLQSLTCYKCLVAVSWKKVHWLSSNQLWRHSRARGLHFVLLDRNVFCYFPHQQHNAVCLALRTVSSDDGNP